MTVESAREAHANRRQYAVKQSEGDAPISFAEIVGDYIGVGFLDERLRENVSFQFQEKNIGSLF